MTNALLNFVSVADRLLRVGTGLSRPLLAFQLGNLLSLANRPDSARSSLSYLADAVGLLLTGAHSSFPIFESAASVKPVSLHAIGVFSLDTGVPAHPAKLEAIAMLNNKKVIEGFMSDSPDVAFKLTVYNLNTF